VTHEIIEHDRDRELSKERRGRWFAGCCISSFFFWSLYAFPPKGALGYEACGILLHGMGCCSKCNIR